VHYLCLVVGADADEELTPFADYLKVDRYKEFLSETDVVSMAEHFHVLATDLQTLALKMPEWQRAEGGVESGRLFFWTTDNPQAKFDWYEEGGRFNGYLQLAVPVAPTGWRRLFGARTKDRANRALKRDVKLEPILAAPPAALLWNGQWRECPITTDHEQIETWNQRFREMFAEIAGDSWLSAIDIHS
jgi:hypothetical protein